jgi:hypothetical protein
MAGVSNREGMVAGTILHSMGSLVVKIAENDLRNL